MKNKFRHVIYITPFSNEYKYFYEAYLLDYDNIEIRDDKTLMIIFEKEGE